jgi:serine/threonine-protein phosphatase 2A regulatory subunit A
VIGKEQYRKIFQPYHLKFLQDPEPEMKAIACLRVEELGELMEVEEVIGKLLPLLKTA